MSQSVRIIKRRIKSSQNISQITKAMEMVSAAKMKRAQALAVNSRPYTDKMYQVITSLSRQAETKTDHFLFRDARTGWDDEQEFTVQVIIFATDKSLCGGLNTNLFRGLEKWLRTLNDEAALPPKTGINFVTVGKKAKEHILKTGRRLLAEFASLGDKPRFADILPLSQLIIDGFRRGQMQLCFLVYMDFISTINQRLAIKQLLPIKPPAPSSDQPLFAFESEYIFEPRADEIFESLLPQYVELQLYHTLLECLASEHSARMVAMKNAHDNAVDVVDQLTLEYNQARQGRITAELLDVTSSRMALE